MPFKALMTPSLQKLFFHVGFAVEMLALVIVHLFLGIPMFFDFNIAFGADNGDFLRQGPDGGFVRNWRFWYIENESKLGNLALLRHLEWEKLFAAVPILDRSHFDDALRQNIERIKAFKQDHIYGLAIKSGYSEDEAAQVTNFLLASTEELEDIINRILAINANCHFDLFSIDDNEYKSLKREDYSENSQTVHHPPYLSQEIVNEVILLQNSLSKKDKIITSLSEKLLESNVHIASLSREINDIRDSVLWQLLMKFHNSFVEKKFPVGSKSRRWYNNLIKISRERMKEIRNKHRYS